MEEKILGLLNSIIGNMSDEFISSTERDEITFNINKNNSISFMAFNNILLKITFQKEKMFIEIRKLACIDLDKLSKEFSEIKYKEDELYIKLYINDVEEINKIDCELKEIYNYLYLNEPVDSFGCCSRYVECSDALKCVSPYKKLARGCQYRKNLEAGRIFYGKNRNV